MTQEPIVLFHKDHLVHPLKPNAGAETASLTLVRAFAEQGYEVLLAAILPEGFINSLDPETKRGSDGVRYLDLTPAYNTGEAFQALQEEYGIEQYHLIVASRALALLESRGHPGALTRLFISHEPSANAFGMAPEIVSNVADRVLCVSYAQRKLFVDAGGDPNKAMVIYNGVNHEIFSPRGNETRDFFRLVFVGALVVDKGLHLLIEAFVLLMQHFPQLTLDVYGSAQLWGRDNYFDIDAVAKQIPRIKFHGAVAQPLIADALRTSGLMVVPSIYFDSAPLVVAEAQAAGLPVLASEHGGMKEIIEDRVTGRIIRDLSSQGLAQEIAELLQDPAQLQRMSEAAVKRAREKFSWSKTVREIVALQNSLLGR